MNAEENKAELTANGFTILNAVYTPEQLHTIISIIESANKENPAFRKAGDLFAIRTFLLLLSEVNSILWNRETISIIRQVLGPDYFIVKSIYFDKPAQSNWFVPFHQDLTIAVAEKRDTPGFTAWTYKQGQIAVQPPRSILESIYTLRIHLDDCNASNGALKVIPGSHKNGILKAGQLENEDSVITCAVKKGGSMFMRPLLMHASDRSTSDNKRRVIHIELSNLELPYGLKWSEYQPLTS